MLIKIVSYFYYTKKNRYDGNKSTLGSLESLNPAVLPPRHLLNRKQSTTADHKDPEIIIAEENGVGGAEAVVSNNGEYLIGEFHN